MFPGLPRFSRSSASVYYTEWKPKNKKWGRPGNEASISALVRKPIRAQGWWQKRLRNKKWVIFVKNLLSMAKGLLCWTLPKGIYPHFQAFSTSTFWLITVCLSLHCCHDAVSNLKLDSEMMLSQGHTLHCLHINLSWKSREQANCEANEQLVILISVGGADGSQHPSSSKLWTLTCCRWPLVCTTSVTEHSWDSHSLVQPGVQAVYVFLK